MFERVAYRKQSGRHLKKWLDESKLTNRSGKRVTLSQVYLILNNPFYYGEFQYPEGGGTWYKGLHDPIITKELFDLTQKQLEVPRKAKWRSKGFAFRDVFKCGNCGAMITPEEKFKLLINGSYKRHVYYHCTRYVDHNCKEPYISEEKLIDKLIEFVQSLEENQFKIGEKLRASFNQYQKVARTVLKQQGVDDDNQIISLKDYATYVLKEGLCKDKEELIRSLNMQIYLHDRELYSERIAQSL